MLIKIAGLGTRVIEICLDTGCVDDALNAAGISKEDLEVRVSGHSVDSCHPLVDGSYLLKDGDIITLVPPRIRGEATVKQDGIWRVHQNDPDDIFPSDYHAHNQERPETLDLYTGNVYHAFTGQWIWKMRRKKLNALLQKLSGG